MGIDEVIKKYRNVELEFDGYYKYQFEYSGYAPDRKLIGFVNISKNNDIYWSDLFPYMKLKELVKQFDKYNINVDGVGYDRD